MRHLHFVDYLNLYLVSVFGFCLTIALGRNVRSSLNTYPRFVSQQQENNVNKSLYWANIRPSASPIASSSYNESVNVRGRNFNPIHAIPTHNNVDWIHSINANNNSSDQRRTMTKDVGMSMKGEQVSPDFESKLLARLIEINRNLNLFPNINKTLDGLQSSMPQLHRAFSSAVSITNIALLGGVLATSIYAAHGKPQEDEMKETSSEALDPDLVNNFRSLYRNRSVSSVESGLHRPPEFIPLYPTNESLYDSFIPKFEGLASIGPPRNSSEEPGISSHNFPPIASLQAELVEELQLH